MLNYQRVTSGTLASFTTSCQSILEPKDVAPSDPKRYQAIPLRKLCLGPSRIAAIDPLGPWSFSGVISGGEGFGTVDA